MKVSKILVTTIVICILLVFVGSIFAEAKATWHEKLEKKIENKDEAFKGDSLTPADFPSKLLPGISQPWVVPKRQYLIAFSNGDMSNFWRLKFVQDMEAWGNKYTERFGVRFVWANSGANSPKQVSDIESLIAMNPDLLIVSTNEAEPLSVIYDMCEEMGVALITVDRGISRPLVGDDKDDCYILHISMDFMSHGVIMGSGIVDYLTEKYGKPIGNVVEIAGQPGAQPGIQRSIGLHLVLDKYPDIRIIASRPGDWERDKAYGIMADWLQKYPAGEIDVVASAYGEGSLGALTAIREAGRDELIGPHFSVDAILEYLEDIQKGECQAVVECPPYFGMLAFEYGIRYLNGEKIPDLVMMPLRTYMGEPASKRKILDEHVEMLNRTGEAFPYMEWGGQGELDVDISEYYPKNWIEDPSLMDLPKFTTDPPIKIQ